MTRISSEDFMNANQRQEPVILASKLVKKYGDLEAVKGVNFAVQRGECFGLLGPNGAGKTSIVRMIYGFSPVTAGTLKIFGEDIMSRPRAIKARIGVVPQDDDLDPALSVRENMIVYAGYFQIGKDVAKKRTEEILTFMDLTDKIDEPVENLSGGLKRRLTLGRGLINQPELLLLDEPTTGLDPYARHLVWQRLRKLKEGGATMLLTTHYMEEASQLCDRLIIVYQGEIVEEGQPGALVERHLGKEALELAGARLGGRGGHYPDSLFSDSEHMIRSRQRRGDDLVLFTDHGLELMERVSEQASRQQIALRYRRLRPSNLEDVFLKLTGEPLREDAPVPLDGRQGEGSVEDAQSTPA
jgi:lipooligosaccharide transport system ATP-binding protein